MCDTLDYDADEAVDHEAAIYRTQAVEDRRQQIRDRLTLGPGEDVLSVGCGPGFEPAEIAEVVGPTGRVYGIDRSQPMLDAATTRCVDLPQVRLSRGDAATLPVADESVDSGSLLR